VGDIETYVIPGLRQNLYGQYTVNLGVHIREVWELDARVSAACSTRLFPGSRARTPPARAPDRPTPAFCQDYHCGRGWASSGFPPPTGGGRSPPIVPATRWWACCNMPWQDGFHSIRRGTKSLRSMSVVVAPWGGRFAAAW
jgi:hypothetical protein